MKTVAATAASAAAAIKSHRRGACRHKTSNIDIGDWGMLSFGGILSLTTAWDKQELRGAPKIALTNGGATV